MSVVSSAPIVSDVNRAPRLLGDQPSRERLQGEQCSRHSGRRKERLWETAVKIQSKQSAYKRRGAIWPGRSARDTPVGDSRRRRDIEQISEKKAWGVGAGPVQAPPNLNHKKLGGFRGCLLSASEGRDGMQWTRPLSSPFSIHLVHARRPMLYGCAGKGENERVYHSPLHRPALLELQRTRNAIPGNIDWTVQHGAELVA
ncbi:MAG: hypothetical protein M1829_001287 [Trizodia sp. TS-e1964]|nr:MAG: hypothetical protein M1829_001287 [Trizodia sp. TS-e1964]